MAVPMQRLAAGACAAQRLYSGMVLQAWPAAAAQQLPLAPLAPCAEIGTSQLAVTRWQGCLNVCWG